MSSNFYLNRFFLITRFSILEIIERHLKSRLSREISRNCNSEFKCSCWVLMMMISNCSVCHNFKHNRVAKWGNFHDCNLCLQHKFSWFFFSFSFLGNFTTFKWRNMPDKQSAKVSNVSTTSTLIWIVKFIVCLTCITIAIITLRYAAIKQAKVYARNIKNALTLKLAFYQFSCRYHFALSVNRWQVKLRFCLLTV